MYCNIEDFEKEKRENMKKRRKKKKEEGWEK
jgi:hypothetical protein